MKLHKIVVAGLALGVAFGALAQAKQEVLVKQRQAAMTLQGKYFGPLAAMAQGKAPFNATVVAHNAGYLEALSHMPWDGFDANTKDVKSATLPAAYSDTAKFKQAAENLQAAVGKLVAASKGSDEAATKAAIGGVGKTCGGCHDDFRQKP
jgi:cytochrome c556